MGAIRVIADDRERDSGLVDALRQLGATVAVQRLKVGDYCLDDRLLVERKTVADFALSLVDGRLFGQAYRLAGSRYRALLLLEGAAPSLDTHRPGVSRESLQGAWITLAVVLGIPVLRSAGPEESARMLVYAARQIRRHVSFAIHRPGWRPRGKRRRQLHILQGLPGVGPLRAAALLDAFGTVAAVMEADAARLAAVPSVGPGTASRIQEALH